MAGTTVELDLSTIIDATVMLTVALGGVAVLDTASNGNLAVPATPVINAITDDPVVSLVSNIGQAENSTSSIFTYDHAQGFTTGSNSAGYTLTSIEVQITTSGSIASAVVRKTDPNTGDLVATLTGPSTGSSVGTGAQTFTAPSGTSLEPSTEYFVVFESGSSANSLTFSLTNADAEDASAAAGWSINDSGHFRNRTQTGNFTAFIGSKRIRVNGTINAITTTDAAQTCTVPTGGIWGACLTAATISIGSTFDTSLPLTGLGCRTTSCGDTSVLTSRDFSFGGKNYSIEAVDLRGGTLEFNLLTPNADTAAADFSSVVLHVGTLSYSLATASFVGNSEAFAWTNTGLSWSANDKVALQLVDLLASTNAPPAFSAATATRSVPENSPASTPVGAPVTATDGDNDTLAYTLEGTAAAAFEIVSTSGQIRTTAGVTYDRETQSSYSVTLKADDGNGGTDTIAVTITLTNVIEPPDRPAAPSVTATAGTADSLDGELDGAVEHRSRHRQLRPAVPGRQQRELDQRPPERERHQRDDREPDRQHLLPGAGAGDQRRRRQPLVAARFGAAQRAGSAKRAAPEPGRHARQPAGDATLDGARLGRRGADHALRVRAGPFGDLDLDRERRDQPHGDGPRQRDGLHLPGAGGQQRRGGGGFGFAVGDTRDHRA